MRPDLMNYWLSQLQEPVQTVGNVSMQMPEMGMHEPSMQMEQEQPEERISPISRGASQGMEAARQSMALSNEQRSRAFGHGLLAFSGNMNRPKHGPGIEGTLGAINEALNPAIAAYLARQDAEREMNAKLLDREDALAQQVRQEASQERHYQQTEALRRDQMEQQAAYRNAMLDLKRDQISAKNGTNGPQFSEEGFDLSGYAPIKGQAMMNRYNKDKHGTAKVLKELNEIEKLDTEYQKLTAGSLINPSNPYIGKAANKAKDVLGYAFSGTASNPSQLRKETVLRQRLESKLNSFTVNAERTLKGGVLGPGMVDRLAKMNIFPTVNEPADIRTAKLKDLKKEIEVVHGAVSKSIKYGKQIDPLDYEEMKNLFEGKDDLPAEEETAELAVNAEKEAIIEELRKRGEL